MSWINAYLPGGDGQTVMTALNAVADKMRQAEWADAELCPDQRRTMDQLRADALTAICTAVLHGTTTGLATSLGLTVGLGGPGGVDIPRWQGRRPNVQVTIALSTLLGLDDQPGDLDGYGPIPAELARLIASDPTGTWRRLVTDEHGQLLDYGRSTYEPPANLRDHLIARDPHCRGAGCRRTSRRAELDHIHNWASGGATSEANMHPLCGTEHHLKHDCGWQVERDPDGTTRWRTPTGRIYDKPPDQLPTDATRPKIESEPNAPPDEPNQPNQADEPDPDEPSAIDEDPPPF
jgi:hypothetical protein